MYVVDIETNGLDGLLWGDKILEVGVCELLMDGSVRKVYHAIVNQPDVMNYKDCWVFNHSTLTPEDVLKGRPEKEVISELHYLLDGEFCTSYNVDFDFSSFILQKPYNIRPLIPFDIMDLSRAAFGVDRHVHAEEAYNKFCNWDPAGIGGHEPHRALEDAYMESWLLMSLLSGAWQIL